MDDLQKVVVLHTQSIRDLIAVVKILKRRIEALENPEEASDERA